MLQCQEHLKVSLCNIDTRVSVHFQATTTSRHQMQNCLAPKLQDGTAHSLSTHTAGPHWQQFQGPVVPNSTHLSELLQLPNFITSSGSKPSVTNKTRLQQPRPTVAESGGAAVGESALLDLEFVEHAADSAAGSISKRELAAAQQKPLSSKRAASPALPVASVGVAGYGSQESTSFASAAAPHELDSVFTSLQGTMMSDEQQGSLAIMPASRLSAKEHPSRGAGVSSMLSTRAATAAKQRARSAQEPYQAKRERALPAEIFVAHTVSSVGHQKCAAGAAAATFALHAHNMMDAPNADNGFVASQMPATDLTRPLPAQSLVAWQDDHHCFQVGSLACFGKP